MHTRNGPYLEVINWSDTKTFPIDHHCGLSILNNTQKFNGPDDDNEVIVSTDDRLEVTDHSGDRRETIIRLDDRFMRLPETSPTSVLQKGPTR